MATDSQRLALNVLELYCGLGGMHAGLAASKFDGQVKAAFDINNIVLQSMVDLSAHVATLAQPCCLVYEHNYPDSKVYNRNIRASCKRTAPAKTIIQAVSRMAESAAGRKDGC